MAEDQDDISPTVLKQPKQISSLSLHTVLQGLCVFLNLEVYFNFKWVSNDFLNMDILILSQLIYPLMILHNFRELCQMQ